MSIYIGNTDPATKQKCPICGSKENVIPIHYGLVMDVPKGYGKDFMLGGCVVDFDSPNWYCKKCEKAIPPIPPENSIQKKGMNKGQ